MRLNKGHKNLILTQIKNQTKSPLTEKIDELEKRFQEWVYSKTDPCFKQYQELYKGSYHTECLRYNSLSRYYGYRLVAYIPNSDWLHGVLKNNTYVTHQDWDSSDDPELDAIVKDFIKTCEAETEYDKDIENLKTAIDSCSTDTQLLEMFPEFGSIIRKVCANQKIAKRLPATMGLPQNLERWGMKLDEENANN